MTLGVNDNAYFHVMLWFLLHWPFITKSLLLSPSKFYQIWGACYLSEEFSISLLFLWQIHVIRKWSYGTIHTIGRWCPVYKLCNMCVFCVGAWVCASKCVVLNALRLKYILIIYWVINVEISNILDWNSCSLQFECLLLGQPVFEPRIWQCLVCHIRHNCLWHLVVVICVGLQLAVLCSFVTYLWNKQLTTDTFDVLNEPPQPVHSVWDGKQ